MSSRRHIEAIRLELSAQTGSRRLEWALAPGIVLLVLLLGVPLLSAPPVHDELYHLLAARGLLETGEPRIADGLYTRGYVYTRLAAWAMALFGDSLAAARLPALFAAALAPAVLFLWLHRSGAGTAAALVAALLFASSPFLIEIAAYARFYSLQVLTVLAGVALLERGLAEGRFLLLLSAGPALAFAFHLQPTSGLVLAGLVPWGGWVLWSRLSGRMRRAVVAACVLASLALALPPVRETAFALWTLYRTPQLFHERFADAFWFYHAWYQLYYPAFWSLTPLLALLALWRHPRPALLSLSVFAVAFLLASFAAPKGNRYLAAAQPFLFALWGTGLAAAAEMFRPFASRLPERVGELPALFGPRRLLPVALACSLFLQPFWVRSVALLAHVPLPFEVPDPDWERAMAVLRPWAERVEVVVDGADVYALAYLGRHDIGFEPSKYHELRGLPETPLRLDPRTGRPVAADPAVLERILGCYRSGLFFARKAQLENPSMFPSATLDLLRRHARELAALAGTGVVAYVWERERPLLSPDLCHDLPPPSSATLPPAVSDPGTGAVRTTPVTVPPISVKQ